ncbi:MAG TPA: hypothetical protein DD706_20940 [Nitrospiraceae bacterium]|nr:hypothetical protein [Nitrospiraceae bacterium]
MTQNRERWERGATSLEQKSLGAFIYFHLLWILIFLAGSEWWGSGGGGEMHKSWPIFCLDD